MTFLLATISTSFIVLSAIAVAVGWYKIKQRNMRSHQKWMTLAAVFAIIFFVIYVSRTLFMGNATFGGPEELRAAYLSFLLFHIVLAVVGAVMGLVSLYLGFKQKYGAHRKIGPWTSLVWFVTAITGVTVYMLLYVVYSPGNFESPIRIIFGG